MFKMNASIVLKLNSFALILPKVRKKTIIILAKPEYINFV